MEYSALRRRGDGPLTRAIIRYREAAADDAIVIARLHAESWRNGAHAAALSEDFMGAPLEEDRRREWEGRMSAPAANQFVIVAEEGDRMVGFACAFGAEDERWGSLFDNLHVLPEWQGRGVGKALFLRVVEWCARGFPDCGMYLLVLEDNARARRLYEALGAADAEACGWEAPGGGYAPSRRYAWTRGQVAALAGAVREG